MYTRRERRAVEPRSMIWALAPLHIHIGAYPALAPAQREDLASPRTCSTLYKEFLR